MSKPLDVILGPCTHPTCLTDECLTASTPFRFSRSERNMHRVLGLCYRVGLQMKVVSPPSGVKPLRMTFPTFAAKVVKG
jgi:hypothetical protein